MTEAEQKVLDKARQWFNSPSAANRRCLKRAIKILTREGAIEQIKAANAPVYDRHLRRPL